MDKYEILAQIGDGTFGTVAKAVSKKTGQLFAVKKMKQKFYTWEECVKLPEVDVVRRLHRHPNIVKLAEVIRENNELFFVFEYMDGDLLGVIKKSKQAQRPEETSTGPAIPYPKIKHYMRQILQSLAYLHKRGYFHRDLKPENLLIRKGGGGGKNSGPSSGNGTSEEEEVVKLGDFGLVKEIRARPPFTDYVSTRWYRAPELLLQDRAYSAPVDIFAAACIMSELITTRPLFPGSNEVDQLFKIMSILGSPTEKTWPGGFALARKIRYTFPSVHGSGLSKVLPSHVPSVAVDLMQQMLKYDPKQRPTAEQCLSHPYFNVGIDESHQNTGLSQRLAAGHTLEASPQSAPTGLPEGGAIPTAGVAGATTLSDPKRFLTAQQPSAAIAYPSSVSLGGANHLPGATPGGVSAQKFYMLSPSHSGKSPLNSASLNIVGASPENKKKPKLDMSVLGTTGVGNNGVYTGASPYTKSVSPNLFGSNSKGGSPKKNACYPLLSNPLRSPANSPSKKSKPSIVSPQGTAGGPGGASSPRALAMLLAGGRGVGQSSTPSVPSLSPAGAGGGQSVGAKDPLGVNLEELLQEFSNELNGHLGLSAQTVKENSSSLGGAEKGSGSLLASGSAALEANALGSASSPKVNLSSGAQATLRGSSLYVNPGGSSSNSTSNDATSGASASQSDGKKSSVNNSLVGAQASESSGSGAEVREVTKLLSLSGASNISGKEKGKEIVSPVVLPQSLVSPSSTTTTTSASPSSATPGMPISSLFGGGTATTSGESRNSPFSDPIAALLQSSRYKSSSFQGTTLNTSNFSSGGARKSSTTPDEKEKLASLPQRGAMKKMSIGGVNTTLVDRTSGKSGGAGVAKGGSTGIGSTIGSTPSKVGASSVSPSIRALLARRQQNLSGGLGANPSEKKSPSFSGFS